MRILLTNDDGIFAKGILDLAYELKIDHKKLLGEDLV